jgi:hypothetical protein
VEHGRDAVKSKKCHVVRKSRGILVVDRDDVVDTVICLEMLLHGFPLDEVEQTMRRLSELLQATYKTPKRCSRAGFATIVDRLVALVQTQVDVLRAADREMKNAEDAATRRLIEIRSAESENIMRGLERLLKK